MDERSDLQVLDQLLARVRRKLVIRNASVYLVQAGLVMLPLLALAVGADQRWNHGKARWAILLATLGGLALYAISRATRGLGERVRSALAVDEGAHLKDRISSAYEFLQEGRLDAARQTQVRDALHHAKTVDFGRVFRFEWPRYSAFLPAAFLALLLSFFIPSLPLPHAIEAAIDPLKQAQMKELEQLQQDLQERNEANQELREVLKKLEDIKKQFEKGDISERDVMLQLARLDESLKNKAADLGVENLEGELNVIVPHLMSSAATREAATALKENKLEKAAEEMDKLAAKLKEQKLTPEQKRELAMNLGVCASKLGGKQNGSFGGDFSKASESLEKSDSEGFNSACKSMGDKLGLVKKARALKSVCQKLGTCKACLGQCDSKELGYKIGSPQLSKSKGGLKAGTATAGTPFGEANRLADGYRQMVRISGQAGEGPVESETEITEGQLSGSQVGLKELHANFAAVAEEVIEKENIPLSHRYHVKRYFQSIRPQE